MAGDLRFIIIALLAALMAAACSSEEPPHRSLDAPVVMLKPRPQALTPAQREELGFPEEVIEQVSTAAKASPEPFYENVLIQAENLKGGAILAKDQLVGFSVRTVTADRLITELSRSLRRKGFLIFRSEHNYGRVPDVVTVIRGKSHYDILATQKTEGVNYKADTKRIIAWLKSEYRRHPFTIIGAGSNWVEVRFTRKPGNLPSLAQRIHTFAPDVVNQGARTQSRLVAEMKELNGFYLWWD